MNLKFIDRVIKANEDTFFRGRRQSSKVLYGGWTIWIAGRGPTTAEKHYTVPSVEELKKPGWLIALCSAFAPPEDPEKSFCSDML